MSGKQQRSGKCVVACDVLQQVVSRDFKIGNLTFTGRFSASLFAQLKLIFTTFSKLWVPTLVLRFEE